MEQRTAEWYQARKGRVTGSSVGAILGVSPWQTEDDVLRRMVREYHGAPSEWNGNVATEYGTLNEPIALQEYQNVSGNIVEECGFFTFDDWLGASPDGLIDDDGLVEIKCPYGLRNKENPEFKSILDQPHYYAQIQIQLLCSNREWCDFWQWSKHGYKKELVARSQTWLDENIPRLYGFYVRYLSELDNPDHLEPLRQNVETLASKKLIDEYFQLKEVSDNASARMKELMWEIVDLCGEKDSIVCGHNLTRVERKGSVQYAKIVKEKLPELDVEEWRGKSSEFWKLS